MASSNSKDFAKRYHSPHMPEIPEESLGPDGRPLSLKPQSPETSHSEKRRSAQSNVSEISEATTKVEARRTHEQYLNVPQNVRSPTSFGPHNEYQAVPSVLEYKASRGRSRISVREATPQEAEAASGHAVPLISNVPEFIGAPPHINMPQSTLQPPFQPRSRTSSPAKLDPVYSATSTTPIGEKRLSEPDSIRSSTTEIRTSTASMPEIRLSTASTRSDSSTVAGHDDPALDLRSNASTLSPNYSPIERTSGLSEKPSMSSVAHSLSHHRSKSSMASYAYQPSEWSDTSTARFPYNYPDNCQPKHASRFSWHVSKKEKAGNWFVRWFTDWWALEILSWCFSVICMIIIVVVLWNADGKPLPRWNLGVSVGAFISIFSGFAKSALLLPTAEALGQLKWTWFTSKRKMIDFEVMDSASRGPIGSLMLLMRSKGITLASVGAAIILLSLPLDLFFQQIVAYPEPYLQDMTVTPPTMARSIWYDPDVDMQWRGDDEIMTNDFQIESILTPYWLSFSIHMLGDLIFNRSKLGQYPRANILQVCPSSNCTFDPFHTLAFDFQCAPMPAETLEFGCQTTSGEWLSTVAYEGPFTAPNITSCGWYLNVPNNMPQLMSGYETRDDGSIGEVLTTRVFPLTDVYTKQQFFNGSVMFPEIHNPVVDFILVSTPDSFEGALRNNTPVIQECEIHWVVKEISTYITHGTPREMALSTLQFENHWDSPWDPENPDVYQANFSMTLPDTHSLTGDNSTYGLSSDAARKVWQSWAEFAPSAFIRPASDGPLRSERVFKMSWLSGSPPHNSVISSDVLPWDAPHNVTDHIAQAVMAMNTVMRNNVLSGTNRQDAAYGRAYRYVTVVEVRWVWISLPVLVLGIAGLFLVATILRAKKDSSIGVWKTSALAVLFNGPGEDVQKFVGEGKRAGYVRKKARDMEVQLGD